MKVKIKKLHPDAIIPKYATQGASGFDFHAIEKVELEPGETKLIRTGLAFEIPVGYELQVRPRSGLSLKTALRVSNAPGTVDADFRGEVCIIITNTEQTEMDYFADASGAISGLSVRGSPTVIHIGDRIAQGVLCPVLQATFDEVVELSETERGSGAFGHTGR